MVRESGLEKKQTGGAEELYTSKWHYISGRRGERPKGGWHWPWKRPKGSSMAVALEQLPRSLLQRPVGKQYIAKLDILAKQVSSILWHLESDIY